MRVRFAPSPTGALHIGGARTALFNWLLARHERGELVVRIEDTDRDRSSPENVAQIIDSLRWLELDWDEGPIVQSERSGRHQEALQALLDSGHAYHSNATAEDVKAYKHRHGAERGFRGEPETGGAVRLRVPEEGATVVHDLIRGETRFEHLHLDDPVIARTDGAVLYNFAVSIDDPDARIPHAARGQAALSHPPKPPSCATAATPRRPGMSVWSARRRSARRRSTRSTSSGRWRGPCWMACAMTPKRASAGWARRGARRSRMCARRWQAPRASTRSPWERPCRRSPSAAG